MAVMVMVEAVLPSAAAVVGLATAVEAVALTGPRTKLTVNEAELVAVPMVAMAVPPNLAVIFALPGVADEGRGGLGGSAPLFVGGAKPPGGGGEVTRAPPPGQV